MKSFSVMEFCAFLDKQIAAVETGFRSELLGIGGIIEADSKGRIGSYHAQVGPFPMWEELAESTKAERLAKGYSDDEPLYREGDLERAISKEATSWTVCVGVKKDEPSPKGTVTLGQIALWQEFGAARKGVAHIPPRPFVGPALYSTIEMTLPIAAAAVLARLTGFSPSMFHGSHFSRAPVTAMSAEVFSYGRSLTGGK